MAVSNHHGSWLLIHYIPVSLFSLRTTHSTSSGGKTLFVPTPYTFKLAMVAGAYRLGGEKMAKDIFHFIKDGKVRFNPPKHLTVNHTFIRIMREPKKKTPELPFTSSIAFREFCYYQGELIIAVHVPNLEQEEVQMLIATAAHINYFGKQGSFFQFISTEIITELPSGFTVLVPDELESITPGHYEIAQFLDDLGDTQAKDLFERINTYSDKSIELNRHRLLKQYLLPYKMIKENNRYTYYQKQI